MVVAWRWDLWLGKSSDKMKCDGTMWRKEERDRALMRAKNKGRERSAGRSQRQLADGKLSAAGCERGWAQCSYHTYLWMLHECGVYVCPCFLVCSHACVCASVPSELRRGTVCAQSSTQMALANRHCKAGGVGTATWCTVGAASHHAFPYAQGREYLLPASWAHWLTV